MSTIRGDRGSQQQNHQQRIKEELVVGVTCEGKKNNRNSDRGDIHQQQQTRENRSYNEEDKN